MRDRMRFRVWDKENKKYISDAGNLRVMTLAEIEESDKYDLEQCTGLKDRNGKLIYEGDILKTSYPRTEFYSVNFWEDGYYDNNCNEFYVRNRLSIVVGNIHENSKLLEG